ncbi:MAG: mechanosensitive ion channel [Alkalinema sp. RL_2_19]|nr:mechanosensitive ion channel [Alkalinema sp. RL_2_19]
MGIHSPLPQVPLLDESQRTPTYFCDAPMTQAIRSSRSEVQRPLASTSPPLLLTNVRLPGYLGRKRLWVSPQGIVEAIELRTTQLRHPDGQLQIIRNGEIGSVINYSKQYIYAKVDVPLAYETPLELVYQIIATTGERLRQAQPDIVLEATQVEGIESFGKSLVLLRTITKVKPGKHRHMQRLLRQLLKDEFETANIALSDYEPEAKSEREG